ncbi:hypothetical protein Tco_0032174 [Tanacetum coccineum]
MVTTENEFGIAKMTINEEIIVVMLFSIFKQQHDNNMELEEVIHESKKRKKEANLATWKGNDVIEIESSDDETIFSGDDDTLDDT